MTNAVIQLSTLFFDALGGKRFQNLLSLDFKILNQPSIAFLSPNVSYSCFNSNLCKAQRYHGPLSVFITGLFLQYLRISLTNFIISMDVLHFVTITPRISQLSTSIAAQIYHHSPPIFVSSNCYTPSIFPCASKKICYFMIPQF